MGHGDEGALVDEGGEDEARVEVGEEEPLVVTGAVEEQVSEEEVAVVVAISPLGVEEGDSGDRHNSAQYHVDPVVKVLVP